MTLFFEKLDYARLGKRLNGRTLALPGNIPLLEVVKNLLLGLPCSNAEWHFE